MKKTILFISPHTDDAELAAGASIARFVEKKHDVHYIALSACELSVPDKFPPDILRKEVAEATKILGIKRKNLTVYDFEVRDFPIQRQGILETFVSIAKDLDPDMVICPSSHDLHQDHKTTRNETLRAFRKSTILGFEMPWDNISFDTEAFNPLEERHIKKKIEALKCYKSQYHRDYLKPKNIKGLARTRGLQISQEFAEAYEVIRWVMHDV